MGLDGPQLGAVLRSAGIALAGVLLGIWGSRRSAAPRSPSPGFPGEVVVKVDPNVMQGNTRFVTNGVTVEFPDGSRIPANDVFAAYEALYFGAALTCHQEVLPRWKGLPIQQHGGDLFKVAHFLWTERPDVMIELGTDTGGSAVFYAELMTGYNPSARVITIDTGDNTARSASGFVPGVLATSSKLWGTAVRQLVGPPLSLVRNVSSMLEELGAAKVFLMEDSDHTYSTVSANLKAYQHLVGPCDWILVHDTLKEPGAVRALNEFLVSHDDFRVNRQYEFCPAGPFTEHPQSWLRRAGPLCGV